MEPSWKYTLCIKNKKDGDTYVHTRGYAGESSEGKSRKTDGLEEEGKLFFSISL